MENEMLNKMGLKTFNMNPYSQNSYIYYDQDSKRAVIFDPGLSKTQLVKHMSDYEIVAIILTHGHFDHIFSLDKVKHLTQAPVYAYADEKALLENPKLNMSAITAQDGKAITATGDVFVNDGDHIKIGEGLFDFFVIHTPGHTAGGMCLYDQANALLFSGDTLFRESIGRTDLPTGNQKALLNSITQKLFTLPDETKVYSGHGKATTIGHEKQNNPYTMM